MRHRMLITLLLAQVLLYALTAIPAVGESAVSPPKAGDRWRMNAMRFTTTFRDPEHPQARMAERSHFSPRGTLHGHHTPELFGDLYFGAKPE